MNDELGARITYTPEDFVRNARYVQSRQSLFRYSYLLAVFIVGCILLFSYLLNPAQFVQTFSQPKNYSVIAIALAIVGIGWIFKGKISEFFIKRSLENQFKSTPALNEPQYIMFDDEGMFGTNQFGSAQTKWQAIIEATETEEDFFFFQSKKFAQFVPKRFFNQEQTNQIRKLARNHLGEKAKL